METAFRKHSGSTSGQLEKGAMNIFDNIINPFAGIATTFRQDSVIKKQFSCLDAEEIHIARTICGLWRIKIVFHPRQIISLCTISQKSRTVLITPKDIVYG